MKFIHIADVHLGAEPEAGTAFSEQRPRELWDSLEAVIALCEREQTDLLLIAGDLFHRQPLKGELKEADYLFGSLTHTKVVLIAGNHDYIRKDSYYRSFSWSENVYPLFGEQPEYVYIKELETAVYGFSYYKREITEPLYDKIKAAGKAKYEILLAHGGDEKHIPIRQNTFDPAFDYVALGHIHKPQSVVKNQAVYAGALEPVDKNDTGKHGLIRGNITENGTSVEFVPFAKREYMHLIVETNESMTAGLIRDRIRALIRENGEQNLYKFLLRGFRSREISFADICRAAEHGSRDSVYGNVLEIVDETSPFYDLEEMKRKNADNLIGMYIDMFEDYTAGSVEEQALYEGLLALTGEG